jgi:uncharacterized protein (TIGR02266 family)
MPKSVSFRVEDAATLETLSRVRVPFVRRVTVRHDQTVEDRFSVDLGMRGVFVEREEPLPPGHAVAVSFLLPGNAIPFQASCRVAWWHPPGVALVSKELPAGVGLEFVDVSALDRERLRRFVLAHLQRRLQGRRFHPEWPDPVDANEEGAR